eukprot:1322438-Heterocapsa_arctica.AAC.1
MSLHLLHVLGPHSQNSMMSLPLMGDPASMQILGSDFGGKSYVQLQPMCLPFILPLFSAVGMH